MTTEKMQTAMRHLRNEDMTAVNWNLPLERLDAQALRAFGLSTGTFVCVVRVMPQVSDSAKKLEVSSTQKMGGIDFLYPAQRIIQLLRQPKSPSAPSVRGRVENPRTWHDCEACDLNHGQSRASGYPGSRAVGKAHNAPVIRDVQVPVRITSDAG